MIYQDSAAAALPSSPVHLREISTLGEGGPTVASRWYVVHSKPHQEDTVESQLRQMGMDVFCPRLKQLKLVRRVRKHVIVPLFPGYLFSRFRLHDQYRAVIYARGVRRVVCFGANPAALDDRLVEGIRDRHVDGYVTVAPRRFAAGQSVRIQEGSLSGLEAVFERELSGTQRAVLLLKALSYQARVIVDLDHVTAA
jgi:transcriptional antiterminator RfaH